MLSVFASQHSPSNGCSFFRIQLYSSSNIANGSSSTVIYSEDFEGVIGNEWNSNITYSYNSTLSLGRFNNDTISLNLSIFSESGISSGSANGTITSMLYFFTFLQRLSINFSEKLSALEVKFFIQ